MRDDRPIIYPPHPNPRRPRLALPPDSCDAHFHVFGPPSRFPYAETRVYTPPAAPVEHYFNLMEVLGIGRGVVVQPNAHGLDNAASLDAIARAGGRFRGVARLDDSADEAEIKRLHAAGFRGVRFNMIAADGGGVDPAMFARVIARIRPFGWSVTFHAMPPDLAAHADWLRAIEIPVVIDHFGRVSFAEGVGQQPFRVLLELLREAHVWVKISCAERLSATGAPYRDAIPFARAILDLAPERTLWGTDWPHSQRYRPGRQPDDGDLVDLLELMVPDEALRRAILVDNPARLFGFDDGPAG